MYLFCYWFLSWCLTTTLEEKFICKDEIWSVIHSMIKHIQKLFKVYLVCVCVCVCLSSLVCVVGYFYVRWCSILVLWVFFFLLNWMFQHDCLDTYCFWVSYMHAFFIFVFAPVQRNWACFTWKSALEICSLKLLSCSKLCHIKALENYQTDFDVHGFCRSLNALVP